MKIENVSQRDLRLALRTANENYAGNLRFATMNEGSFTLGVHDAEEPGGRLGAKKKDGARRLVPGKACWHAYGHFYEALFKVRPDARITTSFGRVTGPTLAEGNWRDLPVAREPGVRYSQLCRCSRDVLVPRGRVSWKGRSIDRGHVRAE